MQVLNTFVQDSLIAGRTKTEIGQVLVEAGWPEDEIASALSRYADVSFAVPVPKRQDSTGPREAFLYLVTFAALHMFAFSLGILLFGIVDVLIKDPLSRPYGYEGDWQREQLRWALAPVLVAFPIFFWQTRLHLIEYAKNPDRRLSPIRKWLTYLTLFVAAIVAVVSLVQLVGGLLGGNLIVPTAIKIGVALLLSTATFGYYRWELSLGEGQRRK
jgi:hypothetical protein